MCTFCTALCTPKRVPYRDYAGPQLLLILQGPFFAGLCGISHFPEYIFPSNYTFQDKVFKQLLENINP